MNCPICGAELVQSELPNLGKLCPNREQPQHRMVDRAILDAWEQGNLSEDDYGAWFLFDYRPPRIQAIVKQILNDGS